MSECECADESSAEGGVGRAQLVDWSDSGCDQRGCGQRGRALGGAELEGKV